MGAEGAVGGECVVAATALEFSSCGQQAEARRLSCRWLGNPGNQVSNHATLLEFDFRLAKLQLLASRRSTAASYAAGGAFQWAAVGLAGWQPA